MRLNVNALCIHLSESEYYKVNEHGCTAPVSPWGIEVPIKLGEAQILNFTTDTTLFKGFLNTIALIKAPHRVIIHH